MIQPQDHERLQPGGTATVSVPFHARLATQAQGPTGPVRAVPPVHAYRETFHFHTTRPSFPRSAYRFIVDSQPWGSCRHTS